MYLEAVLLRNPKYESQSQTCLRQFTRCGNAMLNQAEVQTTVASYERLLKNLTLKHHHVRRNIISDTYIITIVCTINVANGKITIGHNFLRG